MQKRDTFAAVQDVPEGLRVPRLLCIPHLH